MDIHVNCQRVVIYLDIHADISVRMSVSNYPCYGQFEQGWPVLLWATWNFDWQSSPDYWATWKLRHVNARTLRTKMSQEFSLRGKYRDALIWSLTWSQNPPTETHGVLIALQKLQNGSQSCRVGQSGRSKGFICLKWPTKYHLILE